jgi:Putative adhesin
VGREMTTPSPLARGIATVALIAISVGGVAVGFGTRTEHEAREPARQMPAMAALRIDADDGDIRVVARPGDAVTYSSSLRWIGRRPAVTVSAGGDQLRLKSSCPSVLLGAELPIFSRCDVDLVVGVPPASDVSIDSGSGAIALVGLKGAISIDSGTGPITATDLGSPTLTIDSGTGDVSAAFRTRPTRVRVDSGTGDITIRVPSGPYDITSDSGVGSVNVRGIVNDPSADSRLSFDSGVGDIQVEANDE